VFSSYNLVVWSSKRQNIISRSNVEVKLHAMANSVAEACWLRQLLVELQYPLWQTTLI
jgi:hypothetical protein